MPGDRGEVPGVAVHHKLRGCIHGGTEDAASAAAGCGDQDGLRALRAGRWFAVAMIGTRIDRCKDAPRPRSPREAPEPCWSPHDTASMSTVFRASMGASAESVMNR